MPEAKANKLYRTFVRGLITEASPLSFPEDSSFDEDNFVLNREGSRTRRLGVDAEAAHADTTGEAIVESNFENGFVTTYEWLAAGGSGNNNFLVVQVYNRLLFFRITEGSVSAQKHPTEINLDTYKVTDVSVGLHRCNFAAGKGRLFVVNEVMEPLYIEYDSLTNSITAYDYQVNIRDTSGLDDGLRVDELPETLSNEHKYNLWNQGWYPGSVVITGSVDPVSTYKTAQGLYPSNAMIVYLGKSSVGTALEIGNWSSVLQKKNTLGTTRAPRGHYILNAFRKDRITATELDGQAAGIISFANVPTEVINTRPTAVTFYSSRVWLAGVNDKEQNGTIYFSQVIQSPLNISKFYQEADPTNEIISDIVATDGGTITIPEVGTIYRLEAVDSFIVVFASNGIWVVGNSEGFRADDFYVRKISNVGAISQSSIVVAEGVPLFWSVGGIYAIRANDVSNQLRVENVTEQSIQSFYNEQIPSASKYNISAAYDMGEKKVYWLYNSDSSYSGNTYSNRYDAVLVYDMVLQAYYKFSISSLPTNSPYIAAINALSSRRRTSITNSVVDLSGNNVVDSSLNNVITSSFRVGASSSTVKLLVVIPGDTYKISIAEFNNSSFYDWQEWDPAGQGADYTSYLDTGFDIGEDIARAKQVAYIQVACRRTEDTWLGTSDSVELNKRSSCLLQAKWDWHTSSNGKRWSNPIQVYRHVRDYMPAGPVTPFDPGGIVVLTKNRLRGHGRALQLRFSSSPGKDLQLLGWQVAYRGRTND